MTSQAEQAPRPDLSPEPNPQTPTADGAAISPEVDFVCTEHCQIAVPDPPQPKQDQLLASIDFYEDSIILTTMHDDHIVRRPITAQSLVETIRKQAYYQTGLLSSQTLWLTQFNQHTETALWQPPRVRKVSIFTDPSKPPQTMNLPMPGLIFICSPQRPPTIFAALKRPTKLQDTLYHAPLFNIFHSGQSCPGSHNYPQDIHEIPNSFFEAHFTMEGESTKRSQKHPKSLHELWKEIANTGSYPKDDLLPAVTIDHLIRTRS